ncbi:SET domain-containing protein, partial [Mycena metata]
RAQIQHAWNKVARDAGAAGIEFVNEVDDEEVPPGINVLFPYLERGYLLVSDIGVAETNPLVGCRCDAMAGCDDAEASQCSCQAETEGGSAYTPQGLFKFNTDSEIIECNNYCECPPKCSNRVVQFPRRIPVHIFKTDKRGWGARVPVNLVRGRVIGIYTGRREEANKLDGSRASYCFDLDINEGPDEEPPENMYSVDAYGCNWTRFINHSCSPNLQIISVVYDTAPQDNLPYLAFVATQNIPAFTELTFDYNPAHQTEWELRTYKEKTRAKKSKAKKQTRCLCGTSQCRGWLSVIA